MKRLENGELIIYRHGSTFDQNTEYIKSSCNLPSSKTVLRSISMPSGCAIINNLTSTTVNSDQASVASHPTQAPTSSVPTRVLSSAKNVCCRSIPRTFFVGDKRHLSRRL